MNPPPLRLAEAAHPPRADPPDRGPTRSFRHPEGGRALGTTGWTVTEETIESLTRLWLDPTSELDWRCPCVLPPWLEAWWGAFGEEDGGVPLLRAVREDGRTVGLAALLRQGGTARFLGSPDVCDYQDFVVAPGRENAFAQILLDRLRAEGISVLDLGTLRPDAVAKTSVADVAIEQGWYVECAPEDVAVEVELPSTWDGFLAALDAKRRHEVRRKLRRLEEAGAVSFRRVDSGSLEGETSRFLELFAASRADKAAFLTDRRGSFFRALIRNAAGSGLLDLRFLDLDGRPVAAVLCFEHRSTTYLYNNGYDPRLERLSLGFLSKVLSIRESIRQGMARYDFLKGPEPYKRQLGGREIPLYRCRITARGEGKENMR